MKKFTRNLAACGATLFLLAVAAPTGATFYPDRGVVTHDGVSFAESYFLWQTTGPWQNTDPAYEHDASVRSHYFQDCTSWTNLPDAYNDCPTAGVLEPSDLWTFSFGTFHANNIVAATWYYGSWSFSGGGSATTDAYLYGQEGYHGICWFDNIWCMEGVRSQRLASGTVNRGNTWVRTW